jgi:AbrB family looped-hinge helix DNA binding protein
MTTATVSEQCQVVIPKPVRNALGIRPGRKIEVMAYEGSAALVPVHGMREGHARLLAGDRYRSGAG